MLRVPLESSRGVPVRPSQTFAVVSPLPVTIRVPSGEKLTLSTAPVCPLSSSRGVPVCVSQTFAVWSKLPVTIRVPSGEKLTLVDRARVPLEFEQGRAGACVPDLRRLVRTAGDDPRAVGGETHARDPRPVCPLSSSRGVPVRASQTFAVLSALPVTIRVPSGEKLTLVTSARVPLEFEQGRAGARVPDLRRLVSTAGDDPRAVGGETHAQDRGPCAP